MRASTGCDAGWGCSIGCSGIETAEAGGQYHSGEVRQTSPYLEQRRVMAPSCRSRFRQADRVTEEYRVRVASRPEQLTVEKPDIHFNGSATDLRQTGKFNAKKNLTDAVRGREADAEAT